MRSVGRLLATTLAVCLGGPAFALDPAKAVTQYVHEAWTTEQGLPTDSVYAIHQTRDGYLWVGSEGGLDRITRADREALSGHGRLFAFGSRHGLFDDGPLAILEDADGWLWLLTNRGSFRARRNDLDAVAREEWGYAGVEGVLAARASPGSPGSTAATPEEIAERLLAACERHGAGEARTDDRTVVVLAHKPKLPEGPRPGRDMDEGGD